MKRFIALLLLALTLTFSLASCGKPDTTDGEWKYTTTISNVTIYHNIKDIATAEVGKYDVLVSYSWKTPTYNDDMRFETVGTIYIHKEYHSSYYPEGQIGAILEYRDAEDNLVVKALNKLEWPDNTKETR